MAGDWIKMRADLLTHPKVVRIVSALKADKLRVIGGLHAVWCLFDVHSSDGVLDGYTSDVLDDYLGWPGFSAAMVKVGWLEEDAESLTTPRFDEHNGQSAKRRATETQRKREARKELDVSAPDADKKRSREEKIREEKKEEGESAGALDSLPKKLLKDFLEVRAAKNAGPLTDTVKDGIKDEVAKAGITLAEAIKACCLYSWPVFNSVWYAERTAPKPAPAAPARAQPQEKNYIPPVSSIWHESISGIAAKAAELGLDPQDPVMESHPVFKARVLAAASEGIAA